VSDNLNVVLVIQALRAGLYGFGAVLLGDLSSCSADSGRSKPAFRHLPL